MKNYNTALTSLLKIEFPMIMAPMFLVSNQSMMKAGIDQGIAASFPTLNYRSEEDLANAIQTLNTYAKDKPGTFGVNLIAQKSNPYFEKHLQICANNKVPFYITSLGNPKLVIEKAHAYGAKVFCDVVNLEHAQKVYDLGCDGFIAVGQGAGGHSGPNPLQILVRALKTKFDIPVIAAGGIADGWGIASMLALGAEGVSVGTKFIASTEATINEAYKDAIVRAGMNDIVMSNKISGSRATVINTPYAKKIGHQQNFIESFLSSNKTTKKYFKMWVQYSGMKKLEKSVLPANYKTLWIAGKSSELVSKIEPIEAIITRFKKELDQAFNELAKFNVPGNLKL